MVLASAWKKRLITPPQQPNNQIVTALKILLTFIIVSLLWIFFRANDFHDAVMVVSGIFTKMGVPMLRLADFGAIFIAVALLTIKDMKEERGSNIHFLTSENRFVQILSIVIMILFILLMGVLNNDQFIYFQF